MIKSREDLKAYIAADNADFLAKPRKERLISAFCHYPEYDIMRFKKYLRKSEYFFNNSGRSRWTFLRALYYERKKNLLGARLGIEIEMNCFGKGLTLFHGGNIVVNPGVRAGENCKLHGGNCIGNNGKTKTVPVLGDCVDIGFGACIFGAVELADGIIVGGNAVVTKSCLRPGATLVGAPARELEKRGAES